MPKNKLNLEELDSIFVKNNSYISRLIQLRSGHIVQLHKEEPSIGDQVTDDRENIIGIALTNSDENGYFIMRIL